MLYFPLGGQLCYLEELDRNNNGNISIQEFRVLRALNATEDCMPAPTRT